MAFKIKKDGSNDKDVLSSIKVIEEGFNVRNKQDAVIDAIQSLFTEAFIIQDPAGVRKLDSQKLYQAVWRTASRMKPLDFMIYGDSLGRDEVRHRAVQRIVTSGIATVMDKGGYDSALRDKNGAFFDLIMFGDGMIQIGSGEGNIPIEFSNIPSKNIYMDNYASGIRMAGKGRSTQKMVIIYSFSKEEYEALYPDMKGKAEIGRIDRQVRKDQQRTFEQNSVTEDIIEEAHSYDLSARTYTIFAGGKHTIRAKYSGDEYPFIKDGKPYIPILQFICIPSSEGFWNYGIGHLVYKLAIISRQMLNMELNHINDNTLPIELVSLPHGRAASFFGALKDAYQLRAEGHRGFVPVERTPGDDNGVQSQTLISQNLFSEWQLVWDMLDREIRRNGINIDEIDISGNRTATEVLALEENANSFVKQVMEWNASETQNAVEITMDMITEFIKDDDDTPLNLKTPVDIYGRMQRPEGITMGMVAQELKSRNYFVEVNARTGAIPSSALQINKLNMMLPLAQPGSPAQIKLIDEYAKIHGIDIPGQEFVAGAMGQAETPEAGVAETERANIRPGRMQPAI